MLSSIQGGWLGKAMIHRDGHKTDFTRIANSALRDNRLSLDARGLLAFMLTMSDKWDFSIKGLAHQVNISEKTVMRLVKELKAAGYIKQTKIHNKKGQFNTYLWDVFEVAEVTDNRTSENGDFGLTELPKNRTSENRAVGKPNFGFGVPIRTINTKELSIKEQSKDKKESFDVFLDPLPSELKSAFEEFLKMRKTIKAPMTPHALDLAIRKAYQLGDNDPQKAKAVVEQSIMNSWKGLFPLKEKAKTEPISENPFTRLRREEGYES